MPHLHVVSDTDRILEAHSLLASYPITAVFQYPRAVFAFRLDESKGKQKFGVKFLDDEQEISEVSYTICRKLLSKFIKITSSESRDLSESSSKK
eukprot:1394879-Amorphochlora_amoeboformis.AAC.1